MYQYNKVDYMSLNLHEGLENQLLKELPHHISQIKILHNIIVDHKSCHGLRIMEASLPDKGKLKEQLDTYIGEEPLFTFTIDYLERELRILNSYDEDSPPVDLKTMKGFEDEFVTTKRILEAFKLLPYDYKASFKIGKDFNNHFKQLNNYRLSETADISIVDQEYNKAFPIKGEYIYSAQRVLIPLLNLPILVNWQLGETYIHLNVRGYVTKYSESTPILAIKEFIKSFLGLGLAIGFFKFEDIPMDVPTTLPIILHKKVNAGWIFDRAIPLEDKISNNVEQMKIINSNSIFTQLIQNDWFKSNLDKISFAFSNENKSRKIILACNWIFDSYIGENELLSFIQTMIAMEILLGEKGISDIIGISELLRNRCAYLIGRSHQERLAILEDLKNIYDIRSTIVHRGKSRLNNNERFLFYKLRGMCNRVVKEELQLIIKDSKV